MLDLMQAVTRSRRSLTRRKCMHIQRAFVRVTSSIGPLFSAQRVHLDHDVHHALLEHFLQM